MEFTSRSPAQTKKIAVDTARRILVTQRRTRAAVVALEGDLGAGKTVFVQGFARALGIRHPIKSPTFLIVRQYPAGEYTLYHLDCYRIDGPRDLAPLGMGEVFDNPRNIVLIEWADRVRRILPRGTVRVRINHTSPRVRTVTITP